jgi:hypothetical protein
MTGSFKSYVVFDAGRCPECGKIRYLSRKDAKHIARTLNRDHEVNIYRCGDFWHLGRFKYSRVNMKIKTRATERKLRDDQ